MSLDSKKKEALEYASTNNVTVAVYQDGQAYQIMEAFRAYSAGLGPVIKAIVSKHQ